MSLKTEFENSILNGVDEVNRRLFFGKYLGNAEEESVSNFSPLTIEFAVRAIHRFVDLNPKKSIEIHMNSYGGDPYAMLYLHDLILASPCQFKFFGGGAIMSSATWIMAVCDERYLYKNTTVMVHAGSLWLEETHTDAEIRIREDKRLQNELENIYAHNSRMPKSFWTEVCKRDLYLTAEETVMLGLADKIIEPKRRGSLRKMRQASLNSKIPSNVMKKLIMRIYDRIQYPNLKEITINEPTQEMIDETLIIDNTKGDINGTESRTDAADPGDAGQSSSKPSTSKRRKKRVNRRSKT